VRLASFNVENMFRRPKALDQVDWKVGKPILEAYAELQELLGENTYTPPMKARMVKLLTQLGLKGRDEGTWVILRRNRGQLIKRPRNGPITVTADGRGDWIGWLELKREAVNEAATRNTARVMADLDADVLSVIEAEDRTALVRFNADVLPHGFAAAGAAWTYDHVMLIDGNDERGIDVGLFSRQAYPILSMSSHVDDLDTGTEEPIFSRDCAEYEIGLNVGEPVLLLVNHFKSKGYGKPAVSTAKRRRQAERVAEIYRQRRAEGRARVVVMGDLNDTPDSNALAPLITATDLRDASEVAGFDFGGRRGTFGTSNDKIDYLLLSPELFAAASTGGILRSGVWRGPRVKNPWPMYATITRAEQAASDHAAIWVDLDL
jgi:endonuclease/exonuclease/phosphatase family metal-dependent hydrolase